MTDEEREMDIALAEAEQENRLLRARNDRLMAEAQVSNFERTAAWLKACGKQPNAENMSVQVGCMVEEFCELLTCLRTESEGYAKLLDRPRLDLEWFASML